MKKVMIAGLLFVGTLITGTGAGFAMASYQYGYAQLAAGKYTVPATSGTSVGRATITPLSYQYGY